MAGSSKQEPRQEAGEVSDLDFAKSQLEGVLAQKENAKAVFHRAEGAEQALRNMIDRLEGKTAENG